tara:strand:+ start:227 stop:436 length:210 start_codon:yes stop_codon:yes gene_type:complete
MRHHLERKKKKAGCREGAEERELQRTFGHAILVSDLGDVPFREVRVEGCSFIKHCRGFKERERVLEGEY